MTVVVFLLVSLMLICLSVLFISDAYLFLSNPSRMLHPRLAPFVIYWAMSYLL